MSCRLGKAQEFYQFKEQGKYGGRGGIRTPDGLAPMPVFKTGAFNHSATRPQKHMTVDAESRLRCFQVRLKMKNADRLFKLQRELSAFHKGFVIHAS